MPTIRTAAAALLLTASAAFAGPPILHQTEASFEEIATALEDAIVNAGLVIDNTSRVGDMLARTRADVGGDRDIFAQAQSSPSARPWSRAG